MNRQAVNPYLPSWEYIPDGEPHVFNGRVYVYGSHDRFNAPIFCVNDYVCWSAPVEDLSEWRYEGVIYRKKQDPKNPLGYHLLFAPDVCQGPDGRYYLYYAFDFLGIMSVAVCDTPAGEYKFLGHIHYADGTLWGRRRGDQLPFDPGVLVDDDGRVWLYSGFYNAVPAILTGGHKLRCDGGTVLELEKDMVTIKTEPRVIFPKKGPGAFQGHEFFEASSIRKVGDTYYFVYSSILMHELCYATSKNPTRDFVYGGVIVSNCDLHIDTYKPADMPTAYGANNHGSIVQIGEDWYIFYHRHTNNTWYSRQGCAEKLQIMPDGSIPQVKITSCGLNGGPLEGKGEYPAYLACNLFTDTPSVYVGEGNFPRVMQDGRDGDEEVGYIANITDSTTIGFKYFDCHDIREISIWTRGYADGTFEVKTAWDGEVLATLEVQYTNVWEKYTAPVTIPDGIQALYLTYRGNGNAALRSFELS